MTVILSIALLAVILSDYKTQGEARAVVVIAMLRALTILGLATLALLSTGWRL